METSILQNTVGLVNTQSLSLGFRDRWWALSWLLTLSRFPTLFLCIYVMIGTEAQPLLVPLLIALIVLLDVMDGEVFNLSSAAKRQEGRAFRHAVDAIGDRIVIHSVLIAALVVYPLSIGVYLVIVLREIILSLIVAQPFWTKRLIIKANTPSKLGTVCIALTVINSSLNLISPLGLIIAFFCLSSYGIYLYRYHYEEC